MRWTQTDSPAALLLVHVDDERLFGETELVLPLSSIVIQSFDRALKHSSNKHRQASSTPKNICFFLSFKLLFIRYPLTHPCCGHLVGLHVEVRRADLVQSAVVELLRRKQQITVNSEVTAAISHSHNIYVLHKESLFATCESVKLE